MRSLSRANGVLVLAIMVSFAIPIYLLASPLAARVTVAVIVTGMAIGLLTRVLLNRRYGRFRLAPLRRLPYLIPADLPPPPGLLIGRDEELAKICTLLAQAASAGNGPQVVVITGGEGVGKTALGVTAAHIAAPQFPDGQILVRFDTQRSDGNEYARMYLARALSPPSEPEPADEEFDRWYRRQTSRKEILVVLDNVADSVDVKRFLPAGRRCAAIVTSRSPVTDLGKTHAVSLLPLHDSAARDLLEALIDKAEGIEGRHLDKIIAAADGYPAALQMAGAVIRTRRSWDLDVAFGEAETLQVAPRSAAEPAFIGVLNLACALLTDQERSCLALLSLLGSRRVAPWMLVSLAQGAFPSWRDFDEVTAARILDRLTRVRFAEVRVDERSGVTVYRVPGYVQAYAHLLLGGEVDNDGIERANTSFAEVSQARLERTPPHAARLSVYRMLDLGQLDEALHAARENLDVAHMRRRAAVEGTRDEAEAALGDQKLAEVALAEVFAELGWIDDALAYALSAEQSPEKWTQVRALRVQGRIRWRLRQSTAAIEKLLAARTAADASGHDSSERIRVLRELTIAYALSREPGLALETAELAVKLCEESARQTRRQPGVMWAYGLALTANERLEEAQNVLAVADSLSGQADLEQGLWRPWIRHQRAFVALQQEEYDSARSLAASALKGFTALIHRYGSGHCRQLIGRAYFLEGEVDRAIPVLEEALQTLERCGDRWIEADTTYWLGRAYAKKDRAADAASMLHTALAAFETLKDQRSADRTQDALRDLDGTRPTKPTRRPGPLTDLPRVAA